MTKEKFTETPLEEIYQELEKEALNLKESKILSEDEKQAINTLAQSKFTDQFDRKKIK